MAVKAKVSVEGVISLLASQNKDAEIERVRRMKKPTVRNSRYLGQPCFEVYDAAPVAVVANVFVPRTWGCAGGKHAKE